MSMDTADKPRGRVTEERQRRRRRDDLGMSRHRQLAVDTSKFDPNYTYRIINDDPGRIHALTVNDDWDVVTHGMLGERDAKEKGVGSNVEFVVDRQIGKRAVLVRKPIEFYKEDKAKEQAAISDRMKDIQRGKHDGPDALAGPHAYVPSIQRGKHDGPDALAGPHAYVPSGGISIREGGRG